MAKKSIKKNFLYNLSYEIVTILAPLITQPYVSRVLGVEGVGLYSFTFSNVSYFVIFATLGTTAYARREIAALGENPEQYSELFWEIVCVRIINTVIALVSYAAVFSVSGFSTIVLVQAVNILGVAADISWFFQGIEEFKKTAIRSIAIKLAFIAFIFIFIKDSSQVWLYALGYGMIQLIANLSLWLYLPRLVVRTKVEINRIFRHLIPSFMLFIPTVATQIYTVLDKTMIGVITNGTYQNGLYEQAEKISRISLTVYQAYGAVVAPRVTSLFVNKRENEIKNLLGNSLRFMWALALPMLFGMYAIASNLIPWFYGISYEGAIPILRIFSLLLIPVSLSNVLAVQYLVPIRKQNVFTISVISGAVVNILLNAILIPRYSAIGAAMASVISETVITSIQMYYVIRIMKTFRIKEVFAPYVRYWIYALVMFVPIMLLSNSLPSSILHTIAICATGGIIYILELIITRDPIITSGVTTIKEHFKHKN